MSDKILRLARQRYQDGVKGDEENRERDEKQRKFYRGKLEDQWEASDLKKRRNRITVAVNRCPQFVKQITGEMRQNKPAIRVLPVDDKTDPELAEVYSAIIRHVESHSDAHRIYAKTGEQAVIGGIGWFRILTDYLDDTSFDQEIVIKHIRNPLSVVCDPGAVEPTRCDMMWALVTEMIPIKTFESKYPKARSQGFDGDEYENWHTDDKIRVAEYWVREEFDRELLLLSDGSTVYGDELTESSALFLEQAGIQIVNSRKAKDYKVKCYKITAAEVLEEYDWAGRYIPLVPVIGEEIEVGDEVFRHGLVYPMMDSQRAYNFARSAMLETVASQPKAPFLVTTAMVANPKIKQQWDTLNEGNPQVLPYEPDPKAPNGPQRLAPPNFSNAWYQEAQVADGDMKATTGIYDASLGQRSNETSGVAIMARDSQGETASFVYVDNLSAAIRHAGRILIDVIPEIYTGERIIRMMGEDGAIEGYAAINKMLPDGTRLNDVSAGQFDLEVTTGPAFATKRMEAADRMMRLVQAVPGIGQAGADMIVKGLDIPYGDKLADRLALMLVPPGTDPELDQKRQQMQMMMQQAMGPQQPDPMQELTIRELAAKVAKLEAEAAKVGKEVGKAESDMVLNLAKAQQTQVQTGLEDDRVQIEAFEAGYRMAGTGDGL